MFQEQLHDRLVQKYAGSLTVPARKNDIQIDCLVPKLQIMYTDENHKMYLYGQSTMSNHGAKLPLQLQ